MVQRVVLGPLPGGGVGLRASRPGFNVLDPNLTGKQLAFDSRWTKVERVFKRDMISLGSGQPHTVSFGTTFSVIPTVLFMYRPQAQSQWQVVGDTAEQWNSPAQNQLILFDVYTNRFVVRRNNVDVSYIVLRP